MNQIRTTGFLRTALLAAICLAVTGCGHDFGEKVVVNKTDVFYKDGATKSDAEKVAKVLEATGFVDGKRKSVQLIKRGDVREFRMATSNAGAADEATKDSVRRLMLDVSSVFDGAEVEVHLCNSALESKSVVQGLKGRKHTYEQTDIFYDGVTLDQVKNVTSILVAAEFPSQPGIAFHISQPKDTVKIKMASPMEKTTSGPLKMFAMTVARACSSKVFDGKPVDFEFCNPLFKTISTVSSNASPAATTAK